MRIAVIGVGAIGGLLAAKLAQAGEEVSVVARGAHLAAIRDNGLKLIEAEGEIVTHPRASSRIADLGPQDCVVLGGQGASGRRHRRRGSCRARARRRRS